MIALVRSGHEANVGARKLSMLGAAQQLEVLERTWS